VLLVRRRWLQPTLIGISLLAGAVFVAASLVVPVVLLLHVDGRTLSRWSEIGQALSPIGVFFSGIAFIGIAVTLFMQRRELQNQREELGMTIQEQARSSEVTLRQLHTDIIKMAIEDPELLAVWPEISPGVAETRKDHYCNLILNLQKVAFEAGTIELAELRGALANLMTSPDMRLFWHKARTARISVTGGDTAEDFFTFEVDQAFEGASPPRPRGLFSSLRNAARQWAAERRRQRG
jgi:hypothetical protein